jgi:hypothetical protein
MAGFTGAKTRISWRASGPNSDEAEWLLLCLGPGPKAPSAHLDLLPAALRGIERNPLDVYIPTSVRLEVRVAHIVAELRTATADVASRH